MTLVGTGATLPLRLPRQPTLNAYVYLQDALALMSSPDRARNYA